MKQDEKTTTFHFSSQSPEYNTQEYFEVTYKVPFSIIYTYNIWLPSCVELSISHLPFTSVNSPKLTAVWYLTMMSNQNACLNQQINTTQEKALHLFLFKGNNVPFQLYPWLFWYLSHIQVVYMLVGNLLQRRRKTSIRKLLFIWEAWSVYINFYFQIMLDSVIYHQFSDGWFQFIWNQFIGNQIFTFK